MANKLDRIEKDIQKVKSKIAEYNKQLRELEGQKTEQENLQIIQLGLDRGGGRTARRLYLFCEV